MPLACHRALFRKRCMALRRGPFQIWKRPGNS
nr:MAG TPA: hypothetical protein [Caudoviricetes sp.]